ncbi:MAG: rod shape-determining protein RodA [Candidatus Omnitrophica bacterium]|nr:rod shape-determining protein RodA [Candidatus Omnitrophota bacterium]MDD5552906.1 rod shape-determining protein RodA [Candidatus Omnitrophota bacterium]
MTPYFKILIIAVLIAVIGILSIYSSTYQKEGEFWQLVYKRQLLWFILGLAFFFLASKINYRGLWDITYFLYGTCLFLLLLVFVLGIVRLGAQRWLRFFWFSVQPSEIAKLATVIFLARYFSTKSLQDLSLNVNRLGITRSLFLPLFFVAIPMVLVLEQPDLGSAAMLLFIFLAMLFLAGVRKRYIFLILSAIVLCLPLLWHLMRDYQKDRLLVFLNPNLDPLGAGYTIIQSKIAIGSGGLFGKGWLSGTQSSLRFLPESHTDFIFATFAEEWGIAGCLALLFLYYSLIKEGILIARRCADNFGRLLALGISSSLALQVFVNISMNMGLAPVVGLPLPLMSYGGSSMFLTFISLGILANISKTRAIF